MTGNLDRLVSIHGHDKILAADVIDFITDRIDARRREQTGAKVTLYRPRSEAYRFAASKMLRLAESKIVARLLFLGPDLVVQV